ncbi:MAG: cysteine--tRNA ligase [Proteobacteria bacterium]|nr:cysteine--tRNA ligase [Pseudomonadota bacterium]MBU4471558.1 cysteine--tRNA ligase [Pseudomonadota bacterium]MCG2752564.1 cysteine--tRNA ligase [Desulfobacteraceae bacterium]
MPIKIYNTLTRKKEIFLPVEPGKVKMYVCGPTVYDSSHIGHARSVVVFDVVNRYFKIQGYDVTYVRNFTDIDDKIINRANELGVDTQTLTKRFIKEFYADMDALHVERATLEPKATDHIDDIILVIQRLEAKGLAYASGGDVFFRVGKFEGYGKLSGRKLEDMQAGARIDIDENKENPMDFVLWKAAKPGEPSWKSPWGEGRPGWHIECSAMSSHFLGETFDIHGGGKDLIFPHHENEIAQSEGAFDKPFVRYWMHNGFVNINKEKMSKSLGNFLMIKDVLKAYHPEVVRMFLLSSHYRSPIDFSDQVMEESKTGLDKIYALLERIERIPGPSKKNVRSEEHQDLWNRFCEALDDDFNTAQGIGVLFDGARLLNRLLDESGDKLSSEKAAIIYSGKRDMLRMGQALGTLQQSPRDYFESQKTRAVEKKNLDVSEIESLIQKRAEARKEKDWKKADIFRQKLSDLNIVIEDRADGTIWKIKD